ncbi:stress-induced protein YgiW [Pandoraea morbifera]|uniref:Stress-induced protein YgiW n=1 Tax=Pandoraea morbifera TaxID=2508300 RepID=A0A5E4S0R3_9BURK|nr:NirD/YgiW/YdeI family stress tolerance protein [Pandoraea morbifera]VVD67668.1 stress-induced protein YgiW [Pandoraea morbifera]
MPRKSNRFAILPLAAALVAGAFVFASPAQAQINVPPAGGTVAVPAVMPRAVTVEQALAAPNDVEAVIEGYIVNKLKHEHYTFRDAAGKTIEIELDDKHLPPGREITEKTHVRIWGEVDKHQLKSNDIDVKRIEIIE